MMVEWHTAGRRQPEIFGRDMAGRRLIGGPYTSVQAGVMAAAAVVSWLLAMLFRQPTSITVGLVAGATLVAYFVGRRLDLSNGNPYFAVSGFARAMMAAAQPSQLVWARRAIGNPTRPPQKVSSVTYAPVVLDGAPIDDHIAEPSAELPVVVPAATPPQLQSGKPGEGHSPARPQPSGDVSHPSPLAAFLAAAGQNR